jgi:aspartate/methionine/tyrosine aminotransferase
VQRIPRRLEAAFALEPADLERTVTRETRLIVLSNLHNPSGALMPEATLRAIGEMAHRVGAHVLVDEVYIEMLFDRGAPFSFPLGQSMAASSDNPFIVTSSLTKVFGLSGLRCGWVLASPALARRMWLLNDLFGAVAAHPAEDVQMAFDHLEHFRDRAVAPAATARPDAFSIPPELECFRPPAGTVVFLKPLTEIRDLLNLLREKYETTVVPGTFFAAAAFPDWIGGDTAILKAGLERLSAALDDFAKR